MIAAIRELLYLVTNFIVCSVIFTAWNVYDRLPRLNGPNEVFEDLALTIIFYLPLAYLITYVPLRLGLVLLTSRSSGIRRFSARLSGVFLGMALGLVSTHTGLFHYLNPILELTGL